jgi:tetratricopeptide (TPR) repeat protein
VKPRAPKSPPVAKPVSAPGSANGPRSAPLWIWLLLFLAAFAPYAQVGHFDFLNYDDPFYVSQNVHVRGGLTLDNIKWAFTSMEGANWFPLTRISHLLDVEFFGMDSGSQHLTNVLIHALAVLLLLAFLHRATHALWPSVFVALMFALHPLHVESVAWIAERKDVLSAFFWMLSLWAYVRYTERPDRAHYALLMVSFALGLMSKPMIVSLPILLLLLDVWPLKRKPAFGEKVPLFVLSAVVAIATYAAQQAGGAVKTFTAIPAGLRIENALVSYVVYAGKMFWPAGLAVFYPYPTDIPAWQPVLAAIVLLGISVLVVRSLRGSPYLAVGWFWYIVTLAPVIGMVQVGGQARADRYMYVPMTGLTMMVAWGAADMVRRWPRLKPAMTGAAVLGVVACAALTWRQVQFWRNSESLFQHAIEVTERNDVAEHNLGNALLDVPGRLPEAISHLQAAVQINHNSPGAHSDLGNALAKLPGRLADAIAEYRAALRIDANLAVPHNNLGNALLSSGRGREAIGEYQAAMRIQPDFEDARNNLKAAREQAISGDAEYNLGLALAKTPGRMADAIVHFEAALRLNPNHAQAHNNLGFALTSFPARMPEAIGHFEAALRINPNYADAHYNLGVALSNIPGRMPEAIRHLEAAERLRPDPELEQALKRLKQ